jgi:hypothetical protein
VLTEFYSSRTLRSLVLSSADGAAAPFVELLWVRVFKDHCQQFVGKHCDPTAAMYQALLCLKRHSGHGTKLALPICR